MSAAQTETMTTRYEGLVRTAQEVFDAHESSGWRLANVIYDAVGELCEQGYAVRAHHRDDPSRVSATQRLSLDLDRHRMGHQTVHHYHQTWKKYGSPTKRIPDITFGDHLVLAIKVGTKNARRPQAIAALQRLAADRVAGRKSEFGNAEVTVAAALRGTVAGRERTASSTLSLTKGRLRALARLNVWDFPDHAKVLTALDDIQALLDEVKAKPWNPQPSSGPPDSTA